MKDEALPKGTYRVLISNSEGKVTQNGTGRYIAMTFDIIEGEFQRRKIFHNFNIKNDSEMAVKIGLSDLKCLLEAIGSDQPIGYENDLHRLVTDKVLMVKVVHQKDKRDGEMKARIKDFFRDGESDSIPPPTGEVDADSIPF